MTAKLPIYMQWFKEGYLIKETRVFNEIRILINFPTITMF